MFDPNLYPYVRVQNYTDGSLPKVLSDEFYNPTQDYLAMLFGAAMGTSFSIRTEEFDRESGGVVTSGMFGSQLRIANIFNAKAYSTTSLSPGEHGIWQVQVDTKGAFDFIAQDNSCFIGNRQFLWTAKVKMGIKSRLDTVTNEGFLLGLNSTITGLPSFVAGNDKPNWQAFIGTTFFDTGVPATDRTWFWLQIARQKDGIVRWYIKDSAPPGGLVCSQPFPGSLTSCRRFFRMRDSAGLAAAGDYAQIDMYARGIER